VRDVPGALCIPIDEKAYRQNMDGVRWRASKDAAKQVTADMLKIVRLRVLFAPDSDVDLEEAVKGILAKITSGVPKLVLVVFSGQGMRLSVCFERRPVEAGRRQACVWRSAAYGRTESWLADNALRGPWVEQEPFRVCGRAQCLSNLGDEDAQTYFGTTMRPHGDV
jgi:hypothetical protein